VIKTKGIFSEDGHAEIWLSDDDRHIHSPGHPGRRVCHLRKADQPDVRVGMYPRRCPVCQVINLGMSLIPIAFAIIPKAS